MKKILLLIYDYIPNPSANTLCLLKLVDGLQREGHRVSVMSVQSELSSPTYEKKDEIEITRIPLFLDICNRRIRAMKEGSFLSRLCLKVFLLVTSRHVLGYTKCYCGKKAFRCASEIANEQKIDTILSVSFPFSTHVLAHQLKLANPALRWIAYELDPFTYNYTLSTSQIQNRRTLEREIFSKADCIISTLGIPQENMRHNFLQDYAYKTVCLPLPNFDVCRKPLPRNSPFDFFDSEHIHLVFTGFFYGALRSPRPLLNLFRQLQGSNLIFHVFGGGCERDFSEFSEVSDHVVFHGRCAQSLCEQAIEQADILVNFGNDIPNQVPSKLLDYMSTGKPIIHFYYNMSDICLTYLEHYPLHMSIQNEETSSDKICMNFYSFCKNRKNEHLTAKELSLQFEPFLFPAVCKKIVQEVIGERS